MSDPISSVKSSSGSVDASFVDGDSYVRIDRINSAIEGSSRPSSPIGLSSEYYLGGISNEGENTTVNNRIRSYWLGVDYSQIVSISEGWDFRIGYWTEYAADASHFSRWDDWSSGPETVVIPKGSFARILFRKSDDISADLSEYVDSFKDDVAPIHDFCPASWSSDQKGVFFPSATVGVHASFTGSSIEVEFDPNFYIYSDNGLISFVGIYTTDGLELSVPAIPAGKKYYILMLDLNKIVGDSSFSGFNKIVSYNAESLSSALFCYVTNDEFPEGCGDRILCLGIFSSQGYSGFIPKMADSLQLQVVDLSSKSIAIMGDSISTHGAWGSGDLCNVPEIVIGEDDIGKSLSAYATYYDVGTVVGGVEIGIDDVGNEISFVPTESDIGKAVGKTKDHNGNDFDVWWKVAADEMGFTPIPVAWSSSSITSHEGSTDELKCAHAWHPSQIRKCGIRVSGSMERIALDAVIIYRGTNDFSHQPYAKLIDGFFDGPGFSYPDTDEVDGGFGFLEGVAMTIKAIRQAYPSSFIYLCTLNVFKRVDYDAFPTSNGINSLPEYNNAIRAAAEYFGCGLIEFDKDGITFENCYSEGYITDSASTPTHPSEKGHSVMAKKAMQDIAKYWL